MIGGARRQRGELAGSGRVAAQQRIARILEAEGGFLGLQLGLLRAHQRGLLAARLHREFAFGQAGALVIDGGCNELAAGGEDEQLAQLVLIAAEQHALIDPLGERRRPVAAALPLHAALGDEGVADKGAERAAQRIGIGRAPAGHWRGEEARNRRLTRAGVDALAVDALHPVIDHRLQIGRADFGDDLGAAGAAAGIAAQLLRLGDIVAEEAAEQPGAFARENAEQPLDMGLQIGAGGRQIVQLDAQAGEARLHRRVDEARALIGAEDFGKHAPGRDRGDERSAGRTPAFRFDHQIFGAARIDIGHAEDRLAAIGAEDIGLGGIDFPDLVGADGLGIGTAKGNAELAAIKIGIAIIGEQHRFALFDPGDAPVQRAQRRHGPIGMLGLDQLHDAARGERLIGKGGFHRIGDVRMKRPEIAAARATATGAGGIIVGRAGGAAGQIGTGRLGQVADGIPVAGAGTGALDAHPALFGGDAPDMALRRGQAGEPELRDLGSGEMIAGEQVLHSASATSARRWRQ